MKKNRYQKAYRSLLRLRFTPLQGRLERTADDFGSLTLRNQLHAT